jgi:hypothetical protein
MGLGVTWTPMSLRSLFFFIDPIFYFFDQSIRMNITRITEDSLEITP